MWFEVGREECSLCKVVPASRAMAPGMKAEDEGQCSEVLWEFELYFINKGSVLSIPPNEKSCQNYWGDTWLLKASESSVHRSPETHRMSSMGKKKISFHVISMNSYFPLMGGTLC